MEDHCFLLDVSEKAELVNLFFPGSFSSFFVGLYPQRHLESISQVLKNDSRIVFASTLTVFSTGSSQECRYRPQASN